MIYYIEWKDARSECDWGDKEGTLATVKEVGWIIEETKDHLVICSQMNDDIECNFKKEAK